MVRERARRGAGMHGWRGKHGGHGGHGSALVRRAAALAVLPLVGFAAAGGAQGTHPGQAAYERWCAACHGATGAGDGPGAAFMLPRPRDFTRGMYQIRTTASGELPTDDDLRRVIDEGMPGTAMPGWRGKLSERERDDVIAYLKTMSRFFAGESPQPLELGRAPRGGADAVAEGRRVFEAMECNRCHGTMGRGDGSSTPTLTDDWGHPTRAADLTTGWLFSGGGSVEEIHRRLRTGLDGTPMPSFSDVIESGIITEEQLWQVAHYVRSLSPDGPPRVRQVIRARRIEGSLPESPGDSAWLEVEQFYIPLVGQVIVRPRWFTPMITGVWVQGLHDDRRLALRLRWTDPSRSPSAAWNEWHERLRATVPEDGGEATGPHGPDLMVVQFPAALRDDMELPYFLGGGARRPTNQWRWTSDPDGIEEGSATGLGTFAARGGSPRVAHAARWEHGEWTLVLVRELSPADSADAPEFPLGRAIPIAFFAADGSQGEDDWRGAVSSWYAIHLDAPRPLRVYLAPLSTVLITAVLGLVLVRQAQRREHAHERFTKEES